MQAGGLPDVLLLLHSVADSLPNLDNIVAARGRPLGELYAVVLIECLTSSKSETRSAALSLLDVSVEHGAISIESIKKATERLKPALQRSVGPLIAKMAKSALAPSQPEENNTALKNSSASRESDQRLRSKANLMALAPPSLRRRNELTASASAPADNMVDSQQRHPLILSSGKHAAGFTRSIIWSEYPEEPHGSILGNLKRFWAPFLPPATVSALFPVSGIKKQDDAKSGIETLSRALLIDRATGSNALEEQLDLVLKWITCVLCSKESTTGLYDILSFIKDMFGYMLEINREFSDGEAVETIPFLLDRASSAKVQFCQTFFYPVADLSYSCVFV